MEAALRAPSSRGRNPWHFVVVDQLRLLAGLAQAKAHGAEFLAGAPLAIVICAEPERCDVWIEDCAIAAIILQLTAESLGLASCWAQLRLRYRADGSSAEAYVKELLGLPSAWTVPCIIGIGTPQRRLPGHPRASLDFAKIHRNGYPG
jgi:nitroreductase